MASRMLALRGDEDDSADGACQVDMASDPAAGGVTTHDIMALFLDKGPLVGSASEVPFTGGLEQWGLAHVSHLAGLGVLSDKTTNTEAVYQMRPTMIQCRASTALRSPSLVASQPSTKDLAQQSKLGIWLDLYRLGWRLSVFHAEPRIVGRAKLIDGWPWSRCKRCGLALLVAGDIFAKGVLRFCTTAASGTKIAC